MARSPCTPDVANLRRVVEHMDCLSQGGFSEISILAKLALMHLETPHGQQHPDDLPRVLEMIWNKAEDIQDRINSEAETVGCNYTDEAQQRRREARHQAREADKGAQHG